MTDKELMEKRKRIIRGLELTYRKLVEFKKLRKTPIIVSKNGKVFELDPEKALPTIMYKWH